MMHRSWKASVVGRRVPVAFLLHDLLLDLFTHPPTNCLFIPPELLPDLLPYLRHPKQSPQETDLATLFFKALGSDSII